jgi:ABC-type multidrug transport system fused ATPase/permease subunit
MDELELLKKDWKKQEGSFQQISENEIYGMLHKGSSSIVKWIMIISVLELLLWLSISFLTADDEYLKKLELYHLDTLMPIMSVISYGVILFFIFLFFKNYKAINTTDNVKQLMKNILKTRKTVKYYVWYNLGMTAISMIIVFIFQFMYDPSINKMINNASSNIDANTFYCIMLLVYAVVIIVFIGLIWLFYRLLYGILMRRLQKNYDELKKIDY